MNFFAGTGISAWLPADISPKKAPCDNLNSSDWGRIEAALHDTAESFDRLPYGSVNPMSSAAYRRTLDKVQANNKTGRYTPQNSH